MGETKARVLIIGGGFGGLETAKALADVPVSVTLVDRNNHHLFQPLLYQVASAGLSPADIAIPIRAVLSGQENVRVLMGEVTDVDLDQGEARFEDGGVLGFDYLVVAAGAQTNYFGNDHWGQHTVSLKTVEDAIEMRRRVLSAFEKAERETDQARRRRLLTFVVIGAGPTGVELAGAMAELSTRVLAGDYRNLSPDDCRVLLIEMADRVLTSMAPSLSESAQKDLEKLGVEVRLGQAVKSIEDSRVILPNEIIPTETVLWTAGVAPVGLAAKLGTPLKRGRLEVGSDCALPHHPRAFAVGDIALQMGEDGKPLPGVSPVAMQQGRYVASVIEGDLAGRKRAPFEFRDKGAMATIGRSRAVAEIGRLRFSGFFAWFLWLAVHLFYLVGFKNRVSVLLNWIWQYVVYRRGARLITKAWSRPAVPVTEDEAGRALHN
ncbi:MAG: NAD(P)/FAD-dependent oxidoreductase [Myxococcota bacterium]